MDRIFYRENRVVLFAAYGNPRCHRHFAKHILIANQPFDCFVDTQSYRTCSMMIQSQASHAIHQEEPSRMVVFLIDETSQLSKQMDKSFLHHQSACRLPAAIEKQCIALINNACSLQQIDAYVMENMPCPALNNTTYDVRVTAAMRYIAACDTLNNEIYEYLPQKFFLSKSRFLHLFKEEVGIDLKNYLLLKRIEKVYHYVIEKKLCITEAALLAGFSSSSHFADACKKHYGISLTDFLKAQRQ